MTQHDHKQSAQIRGNPDCESFATDCHHEGPHVSSRQKIGERTARGEFLSGKNNKPTCEYGSAIAAKGTLIGISLPGSPPVLTLRDRSNFVLVFYAVNQHGHIRANGTEVTSLLFSTPSQPARSYQGQRDRRDQSF